MEATRTVLMPNQAIQPSLVCLDQNQSVVFMPTQTQSVTAVLNKLKKQPDYEGRSFTQQWSINNFLIVTRIS